MNDALTRLQIEHLRGALTPFSLPFEKGKTLLIIYGENGSGKSSICDAFEFLGKGDIGSLNDRGLGKTAKYWSSHGKSASDVSVTLTTVNQSCVGSMARNGTVIVTPPEHRPRVEVFRKGQIKSLVEAAPADRYKAVQRFVDVSGVESSEDALRRMIRELKERQQIAVAEIGQNQQALHQFWQEAGKPAPGWREWAEAEAAKDLGSLQSEISAIQGLATGFEVLHRAANRIPEATQRLTAAATTAATARMAANESAQRLAHDASETLSILSAARTYLSKHGAPSVCPLCESDERIVDLDQRIEERIERFDAVKVLEAESGRLEKAKEAAELRLKSIREDALAEIDRFQDTCTGNGIPEGVLIPALPVPRDAPALMAWLDGSAQLTMTWEQAVTERLDKKQFSGVLRAAVKTWRENTETQLELERLVPRLDRALDIVVEERRTFSDDVLASIAKEVGRLYELVHPGEGLNKVSLLLDAKKRASLDISASFRGASLPPHAYFSDSHLDTLGICILIALAKRDEPESTILVLDDVVGSVDEPHVDRLIEMVYNEAKAFRHCILTTHYRPWKEKLRWGWLKSGPCQFVELGQWCPVRGLSIVGSVSPDIVRLRVLMAETPPDLQLVCAKAGVVLESLLDFLTQLYECRVPRRAGRRYTLGDLLPSIDNKLRNALRVEILQPGSQTGSVVCQSHALGPILHELTAIAQARNVFGAHFNQLSFELLEHDALRFAEAVELLSALLVDDDRGWPKSGKSGSYWATLGETRRLHPLKNPS